MDIDPVKERPGDAGAVLVDLARSAGAGQGVFSTPPAFTGVHGRNEHDPGGIGNRHQGPRNGYPAILQGLAEDLEYVLFELLLGNCNNNSYSSNIRLEYANIAMKM
jgi:hypothetical protein